MIITSEEKWEISFALLNAQGLIGKRYNKLRSTEMIELFNKKDIIMITETWLSDDCEFDVDGFKCFASHRKNNDKNSKRNSGGILIYVSEKLISNDLHVKTVDDSVIWIRLNGHLFNLDDDLFCCLVYNVPSGSSRNALIDNNIF